MKKLLLLLFLIPNLVMAEPYTWAAGDTIKFLLMPLIMGLLYGLYKLIEFWFSCLFDEDLSQYTSFYLESHPELKERKNFFRKLQDFLYSGIFVVPLLYIGWLIFLAYMGLG